MATGNDNFFETFLSFLGKTLWFILKLVGKLLWFITKKIVEAINNIGK